MGSRSYPNTNEPVFTPVTSAVKRTVILNAHGTWTFALTNSPNAERLAGNNARHIALVDLADCTEVRFMSAIMTESNSVNTPKLRLRYYTSWSATFANYLQIGSVTHADLSLFTGTVNTLQDTGWMALAAGAQADGIAIAMCELGGNGVADPAIGHTQAWFR